MRTFIYFEITKAIKKTATMLEPLLAEFATESAKGSFHSMVKNIICHATMDQTVYMVAKKVLIK